MKKNIEISPNIETLFGTRDENLRLLEDGLNVTIAMQANSIEIVGAASDVARAEQVFADYKHLLRSGFTFVNGCDFGPPHSSLFGGKMGRRTLTPIRPLDT